MVGEAAEGFLGDDNLVDYMQSATHTVHSAISRLTETAAATALLAYKIEDAI